MCRSAQAYLSLVQTYLSPNAGIAGRDGVMGRCRPGGDKPVDKSEYSTVPLYGQLFAAATTQHISAIWRMI
jgi:hypothetical protein